MDTKIILEKHAKWIRSEDGGEQANFSETNLRGMSLRGAELNQADLRESNLRKADLWGAQLEEADLTEADLRGADLHRAVLNCAVLRQAKLRSANLGGTQICCADLRFADLRGADLRGANLAGADLRGADLREADLRNCNLEGTELDDAQFSPYQIIPTEGAFIGWMNAGSYILKIVIPETAERMNPIGSRLCRTDKVQILGTFDQSATGLDAAMVYPENLPDPSYQDGATIVSNQYCPDPRIAGAGGQGIRFFMTFAEAAHFLSASQVPTPVGRQTSSNDGLFVV
jgi:hypothetical protein